RPPPQPPACHKPRCVVQEQERAVREIAVRRGSRAGALLVQTRVDLVRAARADEREEPVVVLAAAERARPVACGEGRRLVEKEQPGEAPGLQQRVPAPAAELEPAGDPALCRPPP